MAVSVLVVTVILWIITGRIGSAAQPTSLQVKSPAFAASSAIPERYTCVGEDASPPLAWSAVPAGTKTLVVLVDDPDAPSGTFTHWIVYNIPADTQGLAENALKVAAPPVGYLQAMNDFGRVGYNGPCPPPGAPHHYHFKLYALATSLNLAHDATVRDLEAAMRGRILASGEMIATFQR
jgi:Raf kinase inhibitor-like YbhB/YbcL family protein